MNSRRFVENCVRASNGLGLRIDGEFWDWRTVMRADSEGWSPIAASDLPDWLLDMLYPKRIVTAEAHPTRGYRINDQSCGMFVAGKDCPPYWTMDNPQRAANARARKELP